MNLKKAQRVFLLGVGGTGMRGLAWLLHEQGKDITGTDSHVPDDLTHIYTLAAEEDAQPLLSGADLMVYTDAVASTHPLRQAAQAANLPALSYPAAVGEIANEHACVIAVAGTHGKSSTTAFLAHILIAAGCNPTVLVGASIFGWPGKNARLGQKEYFLVEADEYRRHFLTLRPTHAIITTIDFDHPDYYTALAEVTAAYGEFLTTLRAAKTLVTTTRLVQSHPVLPWPKKTVQVSSEEIEKAINPIPGDHMKHNAALAISLASQLGINKARAKQYLQSFPGLSRRMEIVGQFKNMDVISDYGHHPAAIAATWDALVEQRPNDSIAIIFEAHMEARLKTFFDQFVQSLMSAPVVVVYPVFAPAGRETASAADLARQLGKALETKGCRAFVLRSKIELPHVLDIMAASCQTAIAFTAGDLDNHLRQIIQPV